MSSNRIVALAVTLLVLACAAAVLLRVLLPSGPLAPDFTLTDQDGHPYTLSAHRGHPIALFFGYAHCPDVCPTTLSALARAKRKLAPGSEPFDVVLVTVDPARDSPAAMADYVSSFDARFVGLSGSPLPVSPEPRRNSIRSMRRTTSIMRSVRARAARTATSSRTVRPCSSFRPADGCGGRATGATRPTNSRF